MENTCNNFYPANPLKLMKVTEINGNGTIRYLLKLVGLIQQIIFRESICLIGNALSFIVPKQICGSDRVLYQIEMPLLTDFCIQDSNMNPLSVNITEVPCMYAYYVTVQVSDSLFYDCDIVLNITKFNLKLSVILCECEDDFVCNASHWKWITSVLN